VNEIQGLNISCTRGLRQRDPLSSLIFMPMANGLHHMIAKCRKERLINELGCRDYTNSVINLHYADASLIFEKECMTQAMILKWILFSYMRWSRLKINYHRSSLVFLREILVNNFRLSLVFNCPVQDYLSHTLGCHLRLAVLRSLSGDNLLIGFIKDLRDGKRDCSLWEGGSL